MPSREPRLLERGTRQPAEHGLGASGSIGRLRRVRPLQRLKVCFLRTKQGGTASIFVALDLDQGGFIFLIK